MPLVTIEVAETVSVDKRRAYDDAVHEGLVKGLGMDAEDRFQVIHQMVRMYDAAEKAAMFEAVAANLEAEGVRPDDVFLLITGNTLEDWYPGARGAR